MNNAGTTPTSTTNTTTSGSTSNSTSTSTARIPTTSVNNTSSSPITNATIVNNTTAANNTTTVTSKITTSSSKASVKPAVTVSQNATLNNITSANTTARTSTRIGSITSNSSPKTSPAANSNSATVSESNNSLWIGVGLGAFFTLGFLAIAYWFYVKCLEYRQLTTPNNAGAIKAKKAARRDEEQANREASELQRFLQTQDLSPHVGARDTALSFFEKEQQAARNDNSKKSGNPKKKPK